MVTILAVSHDQDPSFPDGDEPLVQVGPGILMPAFVKKITSRASSVPFPHRGAVVQKDPVW